MKPQLQPRGDNCLRKQTPPPDGPLGAVCVTEEWGLRPIYSPSSNLLKTQLYRGKKDNNFFAAPLSPLLMTSVCFVRLSVCQDVCVSVCMLSCVSRGVIEWVFVCVSRGLSVCVCVCFCVSASGCVCVSLLACQCQDVCV